MGKKVKEQTNGEENGDKTLEIKEERPDYEDLLPLMNAIAKPLASKKMTKRLFKCVKKASKSKKKLVRGVKDVTKALRKKEKGLVILAGDVSPLDTYSHVPIMCEEHKIPYVFVPARIDLGLACQTKRSACVVLVKKDDDYSDLYSELKEIIKEMPLPI